MKICKDCTVSLSLKGLQSRTGSITVPLSNNNGDSVELTANTENPDAKMNDILFIGKDAGEFWEFDFGAGVNLLLPKTSDINRFDVEMQIVFDPAADENWDTITSRNTLIKFGEGAGTGAANFCYLTCENVTYCGTMPFCLACEGFFLKC